MNYKIIGKYLLISFLLLSCKQMHPSFDDTELVAAEEKSCGFIQNSFGQRVSWKRKIPISFSMASNIPEEFRPIVIKAAEGWNSAMGKQVIEINTTISSSSEWKNDGQNTIYWINNSGVFSSISTQGKSLIRWTGNIINDVDILINANDWTFSAEVKSDSLGILDLESLFVHEFGHALGLGHQAINKSVMFKNLSLDTKRSVPYEKPDVEAAKCEYQ